MRKSIFALLALCIVSFSCSKTDTLPKVAPVIGYSYAGLAFQINGRSVFQGVRFTSDKEVVQMLMDSVHRVSVSIISEWDGGFPNCVIAGEKSVFISKDELHFDGVVMKKYE